MGRSTSCFNFITCAGDPVDGENPAVSESKGSNDKRGWSFRKRSARHRVLSNTVITETPSRSKESPGSDVVHFQPPTESTAAEKITVLKNTDDKSQSVDARVSATVINRKNEIEDDAILEDSVVTVIQAAIRVFLAQKELLRRKNVVKLQAVVRGHLVRSRAVGTLRCVQAIVKMQALVRARVARMAIEGSHAENKLDEKHKDGLSSKRPEKENSVVKSTVTYVSIDKLLSNRFARQLLESTPKTKKINVKCDPLKPNSTWQWLERWMSASAEPSPNEEGLKQQRERDTDNNFASAAEDSVSSEAACELTNSKSEAACELTNSKSNGKETVVTLECDEDQITCVAQNSDFVEAHPNSSSVTENVSLEPEISDLSDMKETTEGTSALPNQTLELDANFQTQINLPLSKPEVESDEQPKRSMKRFATEQLETEGKKFTFGSRKASNPAFIAVQSKFEEMSSTTRSGRTISLPSGESKGDTFSSGADTITHPEDFSGADNIVPHNSRVQFGGSECGTELSVSSTLDSPDRSEVEPLENEYGNKVSEQRPQNANGAGNLEVEDQTASVIVSNYSCSLSDQQDKTNHVSEESHDTVVAVNFLLPKQKQEKEDSDMQKYLDSETGKHACRSSPEASPRSHMAVPESEGTPSSQVSVKPKKDRTDLSGSNHKRKPLPANKRSPSNPNHDSGNRSSMERLQKDPRDGKRRNSFGSAKPDHIDQEPRDSGNNNSLPHFMQATESARAKIHANSSPRSSPDMHDRDIYIKKRHSLPGAGGRQGSPRIQRSMSQAQQGAKGNGSHPSQVKRRYKGCTPVQNSNKERKMKRKYKTTERVRQKPTELYTGKDTELQFEKSQLSKVFFQLLMNDWISWPLSWNILLFLSSHKSHTVMQKRTLYLNLTSCKILERKWQR